MKKLLSNLSDNRATTAISLVSIWSLRLLKTKEKTEIRIILYLLGRQTSRQRFPYSSIFLYLFLKSFLIFYRYSYILLLLPWINSVQNIYLFQSHLEDLKVEKTKCSTWLARKKNLILMMRNTNYFYLKVMFFEFLFWQLSIAEIEPGSYLNDPE